MTSFTLSITKTITIDLSDTDPQSLGRGWAEQVLEALRDEEPEQQIDTADIDTLTGAIKTVIEWDIENTVTDFDIQPDDIKVVVLEEGK